MVKKPKVCVIDENSNVKLGWEQSLGSQASLFFFRDHLEFFDRLSRDPNFSLDFQCIIIGKIYPHLNNFDILESDAIERIRSLTKSPLFLNWQGYISKEELERRFDGKIFHRYGVKWHTLRLRIQRLSSRKEVSIRPMTIAQPSNKKIRQLSRLQRCQELLKVMAARADGVYKDKIEFYAYHDQEMGVQLLEALYNRLLTQKERPTGCPSRYINSSPVIAARILQETLAYH